MAPDVVTGTFTVLGHDGFVLIDPSFTCLFISYEFALRIHGTIKLLGHNMCVSMPAGGVMIVNTVIKSYFIEVYSMTLCVDLIVIKLEEFNVILGMDWLSKYHVIMNYCTKEVIIDVLGVEKDSVNG